jgi:hypothetical protein
MNNQLTYEQLLTENAVLRKENLNLKKQLGMIPDEPQETLPQPNVKIEPQLSTQQQIINNTLSSDDEKLDFFMSLFVGRTDVYVKRWQGKNQKSGYSPVCGNEWVHDICQKPKIKCAVCHNRKLLPLTKEVIRRHMVGADPNCADVIGVYPMLAYETCNFLVADFDDGNWQEDVKTFREICQAHGLNIAVVGLWQVI